MPAMLIDRLHFAAKFPSAALAGAKLTAARKPGFEAIFDAWDGVDHFDTLEWLAYMLATAWHETGTTMLPVREGFKKTDAQAYAHVTAYCAKQGIANYPARHSNGNSYYGRGYVQLTHANNYQKMSSRLKMGSKLYDKPDTVMEPGAAAMILAVGLIDGMFRPAKGTLFDYFNATTQDWYGARELVNGDKAKKPKWAGGKRIGDLIAGYGKGFAMALKYK